MLASSKLRVGPGEVSVTPPGAPWLPSCHVCLLQPNLTIGFAQGLRSPSRLSWPDYFFDLASRRLSAAHCASLKVLQPTFGAPHHMRNNIPLLKHINHLLLNLFSLPHFSRLD